MPVFFIRVRPEKDLNSTILLLGKCSSSHFDLIFHNSISNFRSLICATPRIPYIITVAATWGNGSVLLFE